MLNYCFLRKGGEIEFLLLFYECVCLSSYVERYFVFIFDDFFVVDEKYVSSCMLLCGSFVNIECFVLLL